MISYSIESNIIPVLEHMHQALIPFASVNEVDFQLEVPDKHLVISYLPETLISQLSSILCRIITFTPQKHTIILSVDTVVTEFGNQIRITIINTGTYLGSIEKSILDRITMEVAISRFESGTKFELTYPGNVVTQKNEEADFSEQTTGNQERISPFFQKLREHLKSHFTSTEHIENAAEKRSPREGVFMKKVNAVIMAHLEREGFNTEMLARAMALSRSQLYRKLKPLIGKSPSWYIRNVRLQKAKEMLENEDCTIGEAAFRTGFISQSHFTRAFHDHFGFNPSIMKQKQSSTNSIK